MEVVSTEFMDRALSLENPCNYMEGRALKNCFCPDNILLFRRTSGSFLSKEPLQSHYRFVLLTALQGKGTVILDGKSYELVPGSALLIFPFQTHHYKDVDEKICWLFHGFEATAHKNYLEPLRNLIIDHSGQSQTKLSECLNAYEKEGRQATIELVHHTAGLMNGLLDQVIAEKTTSDDQDSNDLMLQIKEYVEAHMEDQLKVGDIAAHFELSKSYFSALFRKHFGKSLGAYMLSLRLARALKMLSTTDRKIGEIGHECGFDSTFSFGRAFKREFDKTPREYRNIYRDS